MQRARLIRYVFTAFGVGCTSGAGIALSLSKSENNEKLCLFDRFHDKVEAAILEPPNVPNVQSAITVTGFPSIENVRYFNDFVLSYDKRHRSAAWVFEHLRPDKLRTGKQKPERNDCEFYTDLSQHHFFRAENADYFRSGYDRGHLAAAGNRNDLDSCKQTFILSNIAPQVGRGFNRDAWNSLEKMIRKLAKLHKNTYVFTGPLFLPQKHDNGRAYVMYEVIGKNSVSVPTHFFKIVLLELNEGYYELLTYVIPNTALPSDVDLDNYLVPIDAVQRASGLLFFNGVPSKRVIRINKKNV